jgi:6-pyruvoyltetrahydropterin/6-carboxytetrahydropterin synthase
MARQTATLENATSKNTTATRVSCTRKIQFCAGHRVMNHESKCAHLHGHNYEVHITAEAPALDGVGRVVDFSVLKQVVGGWIENNWDHGFLLFQEDREAIAAVSGFLEGKQRLYLMPVNPTAENIATFILELGNKLLREQKPDGDGTTATGTALIKRAGEADLAELINPGGGADRDDLVKIVKTIVWETPNCYAEATAVPQ